MKPSPWFTKSLPFWIPWVLAAIHVTNYLSLINARYRTVATLLPAFLLSQNPAIRLICPNRSLHPLIRLGERSGIWSTESLTGREMIAIPATGSVFGILAAACFATSTRANLNAAIVAFFMLLAGSAIARLARHRMATSAGLGDSVSPGKVVLLIETYRVGLGLTMLVKRYLENWGSKSPPLLADVSRVPAETRRPTNTPRPFQPSQRDAR